MSSQYKVWYFCVPAPVWRDGPYEEGEWVVFVRHADTPMWWREVARFRDLDRAECYVSVENDTLDEFVPKPEENPAPVNTLPVLPVSPIEQIAAVLAEVRARRPVAGEAETLADDILLGRPVDRIATAAPAPTQEWVRDDPSSADGLVDRLLDEAATQAALSLAKAEPPKVEAPKGKTTTKTKNKNKAHLGGAKWAPWTEDAAEMLRSLHGQGMLYSEIAAEMTKRLGKTFTSSMCSGKADRLGLSTKRLRPEQERGPDESVGSAVDDLADNDVADVEPSVEAAAAGPARVTKTVPVYPSPKHDSVGWYPHKPLLSQAVEWYRAQGHVVYKIKEGDSIEYSAVRVDLGDAMPVDRFMEIVNAARAEEKLEPFEIAA